VKIITLWVKVPISYYLKPLVYCILSRRYLFSRSSIASIIAKNGAASRTPSKALAMGVSTLLVVLLGLGAAHVFWQAYGQWASVNETFTLDHSLPHTTPKAVNDIDYAQGIGSAHLFGRLLVTKAPEKVTPLKIPDSLLNVAIKGILALTDAQQSVAILSVENAADKVFKVGAELTLGHRVHQIVADGVVVEHRGKLEMIRLPRASMADLAANSLTLDTNSAAGLGQLRTEVLSNPLALEQHIAFQPYTNNGTFVGYRVNAGNKPVMFQKLGLQANDIVASIDGVSIGELAGRMDILNNLSIASSLTLGVIRNGQEEELVVDFSQ
jgi:general secretion pathway protein C